MHDQEGHRARVELITRLVNREVWVVTAAAEQRRGGLLATWVSAASVDRDHPVMLAAIAPNHFTAELIEAGGSCVLHLLREDQHMLAWNFAHDSGRDRDKLAGHGVTAGRTGSPILTDCLAWLECRTSARLASGDRNFYWADVVDSGHAGGAEPLREQEFFARCDRAQRAVLQSRLAQDVAWQRPAQQRWRQALPPLLRPLV